MEYGQTRDAGPLCGKPQIAFTVDDRLVQIVGAQDGIGIRSQIMAQFPCCGVEHEESVAASGYIDLAMCTAHDVKRALE